MGSLNYTKATHEQSGIVRFQANVSGLKGSGSNQTACNLLCVPYKNDTWSNVVGTTNDKSICGLGSLGGTIAIQDSAYSSGSETAFKTAMSGVYLVYELATPTTETADTFENPQLVDNWGTEEYTDSREVQIPVGHITKYPPDLKAKLENMPSIPKAPTTNGTYVLKATVSGGVATYSWISE